MVKLPLLQVYNADGSVVTISLGSQLATREVVYGYKEGRDLILISERRRDDDSFSWEGIYLLKNPKSQRGYFNACKIFSGELEHAIFTEEARVKTYIGLKRAISLFDIKPRFWQKSYIES